MATLLAALALLTLATGCAVEGKPTPVPESDSVARTYLDVERLYSGPEGLYAGCGPNNGVCHNSKQYPDLSSLGSVVDAIDTPCNELVDKPAKMHDLCERPGDALVVGGERIEIAWIEPVDADAPLPGTWRIVLATPSPPAPALDGNLVVERAAQPESVVVAELSALSVEIDATDPRVVVVTLPAPDPALGEDDPGLYMSQTLSHAGVPADPAAIQVGDPNRNGTFGAQLQGRLIKPGDPDKSYVLRRLTDPAAGPLMPLANCCHWSKPAVRALWCWIAGLDAQGDNALDPIDYVACPPGPATEHLAYPDLGEGCEGSGMCPIQSTLPVSDEPTWNNVYANIMTRRCAGSGCHFDGAAGGLGLADENAAYGALVDGRRVVKGDPNASVLFQRITQACAPGASCARMPLGLDPLSADEIEAVRGWIEQGASH